jgi:hypothetical protein
MLIAGLVSGLPVAVNRPGLRLGRIVEAGARRLHPGSSHGTRVAVRLGSISDLPPGIGRVSRRLRAQFATCPVGKILQQAEAVGFGDG